MIYYKTISFVVSVFACAATGAVVGAAVLLSGSGEQNPVAVWTLGGVAVGMILGTLAAAVTE